MEAALLIYTYLVVGDLTEIMAAVAVVLAIVCLFVYLVCVLEEPGSNMKTEEGVEGAKGFITKGMRCLKILVPVVVLLYGLYPGKEDLAWIFGGAAAVSLAENERAQQLPDNVLRAANQVLEDYNGEAEDG